MARRRPCWSARDSYLAAIALVLCLPAVHPAVFTVDYGSEWIKVAVVSPRLKPDPIAIAINEMSKRKSPALVAISNGERLVSEEAAAIIGRYPDRVYTRARDLIGVPLEAAEQMLASTYSGYKVTGPPEDSSESGIKVAPGMQKVWIRTHNGQTYYSAEELVAMILEYAQHLSETHAKFEVVDAVVSVPPFFSQSQRQSLLDAALLVGINVMSLVHEHSAAALQYGMFRTKELEEPRNVLLYDMGGASTYAALLYYSSYTVKERGKNVTSPQFQVRAVRWDSDLGGQSLELRLLEHFSKEFNKQMRGSFDVRKFPKSMGKLRKAVRRTKEVLSANSDAPISVESLYEENDFRSSITRDKFEELCANLWPRALTPMKQVLADAGLDIQDLYAVELIGGGTRVPKIQAVLQEFLGPNKTLDRHLDADESVALGASWLAANLSDGFKLNRRIGMVDGMPYGVTYKVKGIPPTTTRTSTTTSTSTVSVEESEESLIPRLKKFPLKIIRSLKQHPKEDFELSLLYEEAEGLPPSWPSGTPIVTYNILGAKNATDKYSSYNLSSPLKTSVHFEISRSGIVSVEKAEVVVEFSEWTEVKVPIISNKTNSTSGETNTTDTTNSTDSTNSTNGSDSSANNSTNSSSKGNATEDESKDSSKDGDAKGASDSDAAGNGTEPVTEEEPQFEMKQKLRKRTIRVPLQVVDVTEGFQSLMSEAEAKAAEKRIDALRAKEAEKRSIAEAKNALESYIYATKEKLESGDDTLLEVSTEKQREDIRTQLVEAEDWLYMDGENAGATELKSKLAEIKKDPEAIFFRQRELKERPETVRRARELIEDTRETLSIWKDSKPWINQTTHVKPLHEDLTELEQWLNEKESEQKQLKDHEEPAFSSKNVSNRMNTIREKVLKVERIPKPKPPKAPKPELKSNETTGNSTEAEKGNEEDEKKPPHDEL